MTYSDKILTAYLSGTLDAETSAALEQAVADDPAIEARLIALDPFAAPVKAAFEGIPTSDRLSDMKPEIEVPPTSSVVTPLLRYAAATLAGVAIGYGVFVSQGPKENDWHAQVAAYQLLYVTETVDNISTSPEKLVAQFQAAQSQLDLDLQQATLSDIPSLDLKRAQILGFNDEPLIQIAFQDDTGAPIALCIIRNQAGSTPLGSETLAGLASANWSTDTHSFLLIGGTQQDKISLIAEDLVGVF